MILNILRPCLKAIFLFSFFCVAACSPPAPPPAPIVPGPPTPAPAPQPALPVLGELPAVTLVHNKGGYLDLSETRGRPLLLWFHHPVTEASVTQGKAMASMDPGNVFRKIVLIPMPEAIAEFPRFKLPFDAEVTACPPPIREALGNLRAIPTVLLVDTEGKIRLRQEGSLDIPAIVSAMKTLSPNP